MSTSKHLITALERADWLDRLLVFAGLAFFILVVLFILKQRVVDRGIRIAFWWTRFIPDFSGDEALLAMDVEKGELEQTFSTSASSVAAAVSTALGTASSIAASLVSASGSVHGAHDVSTSILEVTTPSISDSSSLNQPATTSLDAEGHTETSSSSHDEL